MKTIKLYYVSTAWGTGCHIDEPTSTGPNSEEGYFEPGQYDEHDYIIPADFEIRMSEGGKREFYRGNEHFALTHRGRSPVLTNGRENITLKRA